MRQHHGVYAAFVGAEVTHCVVATLDDVVDVIARRSPELVEIPRDAATWDVELDRER